jgi:hypothetical protein
MSQGSLTMLSKETYLRCGKLVERLDDTLTRPSYAPGPVLWNNETEVTLPKINWMEDSL